MEKENKGVLILTPFFSPNIGGVETHLDDLVSALDRLEYRTHVLTYSPITTDGVQWAAKERKGQNIYIRRYRWFGRNLFHRVEGHPFLDFLYLTPYLGLRTLIFMLFNRKKIDVIHAHGLNAALIGYVIKRLFSKRLVVSTHAVYEIKAETRTARHIRSILSHADKVLCLSKASLEELKHLGIEKEKLDLYKYWINLDIFKPAESNDIIAELRSENAFTVLFVGRLIEKKGVAELLAVARQLPSVNFVFIGTGPMENVLKAEMRRCSNVFFLGKVSNAQLARHYNSADVFCIPSQYEEGFGRVAMEAVACGLPVVGSDKGGIPEALDRSVALLSPPTVENLREGIRMLKDDNGIYDKLKCNSRNFAVMNFSEENITLITKHY